MLNKEIFEWRPSEATRVSTGSSETETIIRSMIETLISKWDSYETALTWEMLDLGPYKSLWFLRCMLFWRNAENSSNYWAVNRYPKSEADDDTGDFIRLIDTNIHPEDITEENFRTLQFQVTEKVRRALSGR